LTDKNEKENSSPNVNADKKSKSLIVDNVFIYLENIFNKKAIDKRKKISSSVVTSDTWCKQKKLEEEKKEKDFIAQNEKNNKKRIK